jgi:hypothetical protein
MLTCGVSRRCITPPDHLISRLVGLKQQKFAGVIDDLYVRVIALENGKNRALIVSFDMTTAPCTEQILDELSTLTGTNKENILFFSIHTHSVPFNSIDMEEAERQTEDTILASEAFRDFLLEQTRQAAMEACTELVPVRMGYGWGESHVNVIRLQDYDYRLDDGTVFSACNLGADPSRFADPTLFAMRLEDMDGHPKAFLVNYAMHNVATIWNDFDGSGRMGVSSDIGGNVSRILEERNKGAVAVWSSGAAGDLNPLLLNEVILPSPQTGRNYEYHPKGCEFARMSLKIMTERHLADICHLLGQIHCGETETEIHGTVEWSVTPGCGCIRHHGAPPEFVTGDGVPEHTVRLQQVQIGSLTLIGIGAELYSSLGRAMIQAAPEHTVLITHNASALCNSHYILDDETIARCDASHGFAMVPGYDEYRCMAGVMEVDLIAHVKSMTQKIEAAESNG